MQILFRWMRIIRPMNIFTLSLVPFIANSESTNNIIFNEAFSTIRGSYVEPAGGKLALWDQMPLGHTVSLLYKSNDYCKTKVKTHGLFGFFDVETAAESQKVSYLDPADNCDPKKSFIAVVSNTPIQYIAASLKSIAHTKLLNAVVDANRKRENPKFPAYLAISSEQGSVWQINNSLNIQNLTLVQLHRGVTGDKEGQPGPLYISNNNKLQILGHPCVNNIQPFVLNDNLYLKLMQIGCDGGEIVALVYRIDKESAECVYYNPRWEP